MAKSDAGNYFRRTSLFWIISVTLGFGHFTWIVFAPETFPLQYLGPYGTFCDYLQTNFAAALYKLWWAAFAIHVFESFVALKLCREKGINDTATRCLWCVQTFLFGFASLGLLVKYEPDRPKQN